MSLRQYEYALAVAEAGSVTAAAELLHVAQPSMSQQIRGMERELGVRLFARTPTGLVPTVVGRAFLREAEVAVSASRRARATARAGADELVGELVVAVQMGFGTRLEVTVFEEPRSAELERLCRRGVLDLALMAACERSPADAHHLGDEELVVVLGAGHRQLAADRVELRELEGEPWVRFDRDSALDGGLLAVLRDNELTPATVARVSQTATAVRWAAHGLGVTLVPASVVPERRRLRSRTSSACCSPGPHVGLHEGGPLRHRARRRPGGREHLGARVQELAHDGRSDSARTTRDQGPLSREFSLSRSVDRSHSTGPLDGAFVRSTEEGSTCAERESSEVAARTSRPEPSGEHEDTPRRGGRRVDVRSGERSADRPDDGPQRVEAPARRRRGPAHPSSPTPRSFSCRRPTGATRRQEPHGDRSPKCEGDQRWGVRGAKPLRRGGLGARPPEDTPPSRRGKLRRSRSEQAKPRDGGQGRGRTADLPLFRRSLVPTELPGRARCCVHRE
jgi:DNA-binding transcriptional LysR family regulator